MDPRAARRARRSRLRDQSEHENTAASGDDQGQTPSTALAGAGDRDASLEEVGEDDLCPICQLLLLNPVKTTCNHTLCRTCMALWAQTSEAPMIRVDVDEEPVPFDPVSELEACCPMCRTMTSAREDARRASELQARYPRMWDEREQEAAEDGASEELADASAIQIITVYIGNRHELVQPDVAGNGDLPQNQHQWTFFVKPSRTDIVKEVRLFLHPTFRPSTIVCRRPPYELQRVGWGIFIFEASIVLKAGYSWVSEQAQDDPRPGGGNAPKAVLPLEWLMDFEGFAGKGSMSRIRLKFKKNA